MSKNQNKNPSNDTPSMPSDSLPVEGGSMPPETKGVNIASEAKGQAKPVAAIGRIVHYQPKSEPKILATEPDALPDVARDLPAIITKVNADGTVALSIFGTRNGVEQKDQVKLGDELQLGSARWPQY